jgi:SWI/SNF-related matrix-associated actin-dependent regulator of chromatin subfamily B protein 1
MKPYPIDPSTDKPVKADEPAPDNVKYQYLPRIKCNDCPGKVYSAGPQDAPAENFEVHLKNRVHKEKVDTRRRNSGA